jgi:predicted HAD superfamily Cof-like phosphohydrolase
VNAEQQMVRDFHAKFNFTANPISEEPKLLPLPIFEKRLQFIRDEVDELVDAMYEKDLSDRERVVKIADALADITYLVYGNAVAHGIDLEAVFAEVHRSNMTKSPSLDVDGKASKGPDYSPPQLEHILFPSKEVPR